MTMMNTTAPALTDDMVQQFWEQGYILLKGLIPKDEAAVYRQHILDLMPRDLSIPAHWGSNAGRIKPIKPNGGSHTYDTPELLPLLQNEMLYAIAAQLLGSPRLRVGDGSLGITLRNASGGDTILSQNVHLDASVPPDLDQFLFTPQELQVGGCYYLSDVQPTGGGIHVVPGGHKMVEERARTSAKGRQLYNRWKNIEDFPQTVEVTGEAGDFALLHHLMPHAASHNRLPVPRVAQFTRFTRDDHAHSPAKPVPEHRYNEEQLRVMTPLGRRLFGLDLW